MNELDRTKELLLHLENLIKQCAQLDEDILTEDDRAIIQLARQLMNEPNSESLLRKIAEIIHKPIKEERKIKEAKLTQKRSRRS
jgi:hypothetical protein